MLIQIPTRCRYALSALLALCAERGGQPLKISDIADRQGLPARYLESILKSLKQPGIVGSKRGSEGGYWLEADPERVTVAQVVAAVDGPISDWSGLAVDDDDGDELDNLWHRAALGFEQALGGITLADLSRARQARIGRESSNWVI